MAGPVQFVSPDGLLFTNHHVSALHPEAERRRARLHGERFLRCHRSRRDRLPRPGGQRSAEDRKRHSRVNANVKPGMDAAKANRERKASMAAIEKECSASTKNRCDVVTLFPGNRYDLYQYKKYTDIRLVFAQIGHRVVRRRSRQLYLPSFRSGLRPVSPLRKRQAGENPALFSVEPDGRPGW